eukprot:14123631-Ditylum_brightwellii.AAC.1
MVDNADNDSIAFTLDGNNDTDYEEEEVLGKDVKRATKLENMSLTQKPSPMSANTCHSLRNTPIKRPIKKKYSIPPTPPCSLSDSVQDYPPSLGSIDYNDACQIYGITDPEPLLF